MSGSLGSSASCPGFRGAYTASSHRRDPGHCVGPPPARPGLAAALSRGSQTRRKAEPRGRELTGRTETGMAKPVAMLPGLGSLAGHPASGLRSWAEMESAWTERALTFHRLGFGAEVGLQVPSGFPLSACGWKWVCARVCVHTCVSVLRNCCVENVTTWITVP